MVVQILKYPGPLASFGELLTFHLERGTRPDGSVARWKQEELAEAAATSARTIRSWQKNEHFPGSLTGVERALFRTNARYDQWRSDLRNALARAQRRPAVATPEEVPPSPAQVDILISEQRKQSDRLAALMVLLEKNGGLERARSEGISEQAVRRLVEQLGGEVIDKDELVPWLERWIADASRRLTQHVDNDAAFQSALDEAKRRFSAGRGDASDALLDEFDREESFETVRQNERKVRRISLLRAAIDYADLALNHRAAIANNILLSEIEHGDAAVVRGENLLAAASSYADRGDAREDTSKLLTAEGLALAARACFTSGGTRKLRIACLRLLARCFAQRAIWDGDVDLMARAVSLNEEICGQVLIREQSWASDHLDLGFALIGLGRMKDDTSIQEKGIELYKTVIGSIDQSHDHWVDAHTYLFDGLSEFGFSTGNVQVMVDSLAIAREMRQPIPKSTAVDQWVKINKALANCLIRLGPKVDPATSEQYFLEAISVLTDVLTVPDVEASPGETAHILASICMCYTSMCWIGISRGKDQSELLMQGIAAGRLALEAAKKDPLPTVWDRAAGTLGMALKLYSVTQHDPAIAAEMAALAGSEKPPLTSL